MAKRLTSMPLAISQEETALAVVRLDQVPVKARSAASQARKGHLRMSQALSGQHSNGQRQDSPSLNGQSLNGQSLNGPSQNGQSRNGPTQNGPSKIGQSRNGHGVNAQMSGSSITDDLRSLIREHRLDQASRIVAALLDQRITDGDSELSAARMLLQHYDMILSRQPPLSHVGAVPLRPNDRLYACFDQFIDLIRQQQSQVSELQAIIAELI